MIDKLLIEFGNSCDEYDWESDLDYLQTLLDEISYKSENWKATVEGFGWRNLDGELDIQGTKKASEIINKLMPDCDWTVQIFKNGKRGLKFNCVHHDSPVWGKEWYYLKPVR